MNKKRKIKSIIIKNFQSHANTELELCDGVNVILGNSDVGKTAILRALGWIFFNKPSGTTFIRNGETEAFIKIVYDDGHIITRLRNKTFNGYKIYYPEEDKLEEFSGLGKNNVPEEVMEITGVRNFKIADDLEVPVTYHTQLEGPFLLSLSTDKKAKAIGSITNVGNIDLAIKKGRAYSREYKNKLSSAEDKLKKENEHLNNFINLDKKKKNLENIKSIYNAINEQNEKIDRLKTYSNKYDEINEKIKIEENKIKSFNAIDILNQKFTGIDEKIKEGNDLFSKLSRYKTIENEIAKTSKFISNTEGLEDINKRIDEVQLLTNKREMLINLNIKLKYLNSGLNDVQSIYDSDLVNTLTKSYDYLIKRIYDYVELINQYSALKNTNELISKIEILIKNEEIAIKNNVENYLELISSEKVCPICGSDITKSHVDKIRKEYYTRYEI